MQDSNKYRVVIRISNESELDLLDPDPSMINIRDIARALSKKCRFAGHCLWFYSVAEHSCHAVTLARKISQPSIQTQRAILLHDAAEAYIGDIVTPLKKQLPLVANIERNILEAIGSALSVDISAHADLCEIYDKILLHVEWNAEYPQAPKLTPAFANVPEESIPQLEYWEWHTAESRFIEECKRLDLWR